MLVKYLISFRSKSLTPSAKGLLLIKSGLLYLPRYCLLLWVEFLIRWLKCCLCLVGNGTACCFLVGRGNPSICIYSSIWAWKTKYCLQVLPHACGLDLESRCPLYLKFCEKLTKGDTWGEVVWEIPCVHLQEQMSWEHISYSPPPSVFPSQLGLCGGEFPAHWHSASTVDG